MFTFFWSLIKNIMGAISQNFNYWWGRCQRIFQPGHYGVTGSITLGPGMQEITIGTEIPNPASVFVSVTEPPAAVTTCIGGLNWVATRLTSGGFVLFANIASASCTIEYVVRYNNEHSDHPVV